MFLCMYVRVYLCMCIYVVLSTFVTKYNKLQLRGIAARMEKNIHTIFSRGHIMEHTHTNTHTKKRRTEIMGWKHH